MRGPHEHGERGGFRGRHGPGGRLARLLEHGDLRMLILHLINEKPRHGYEIIKAIEDLAGGAYAPSPGVVYPTLTMLEELGQITATEEGSRKSYAITSAGAETLAADQEAVNAILARIASAGPRENALPILRAMENLGNVLRIKVRTKATSPEVVSKIVDTLDAIARKIEEF
jgi:DNA-binding PadR family transcriptional regulator